MFKTYQPVKRCKMEIFFCYFCLIPPSYDSEISILFEIFAYSSKRAALTFWYPPFNFFLIDWLPYIKLTNSDLLHTISKFNQKPFCNLRCLCFFKIIFIFLSDPNWEQYSANEEAMLVLFSSPCLYQGWWEQVYTTDFNLLKITILWRKIIKFICTFKYLI